MKDDPKMLIGDLIHRIGSATLVDAALGTARGLAFDVRSGRRALSDEESMKVRVLDEIVTDVTESRGRAQANPWLIASNELLDGLNPLGAIRKGRYEAVRDAARAFIDGPV